MGKTAEVTDPISQRERKGAADRPRARTFAYYLVGGLLIALSFFVVAELLTRTVSWVTGKGFTLALHELDPHDAGVEDIYQWHPFAGFTFRPLRRFEGSHPNQRERVMLLVDQHGFLASDHGLSFHRAENEIRIATIGGSTTANIQLAYEQNWPGKLGSLIEQAFPGKRVRVINAAVPGFDTAQSVANLALRVMPFEPDVVIIYHAYNDLKAIRPGLSFRPDYSHIHSRPHGYHEKPAVLIRWLNQSMFYVRARNRYRKLAQLTAYRDSFTQSRRTSEIPADAAAAFEQHVRTLVAIARTGGAKVVLSSFATLHDPSLRYAADSPATRASLRQKQELAGIMYFTPGLTLDGIFNGLSRYSAILRKIAQEEQTGWVDNAVLVPHEDVYFVDRVHFSPRGATRMAENFLPVVLEQLGQAPRVR